MGQEHMIHKEVTKMRPFGDLMDCEFVMYKDSHREKGAHSCTVRVITFFFLDNSTFGRK